MSMVDTQMPVVMAQSAFLREQVQVLKLPLCFADTNHHIVQVAPCIHGCHLNLWQ